MKMIKPLMGAALLSVAITPGVAFSITQTISASIGFDALISITKTNDISFGIVEAGKAGTFTLSPTGDITADNGGVFLGGSAQAGSLTIAGSATQAIDISVNNYTPKSGVTPSAATCIYDGGAASPCALSSQAAPGTGKTLLVGVTVAVDGTQATGTTAAPSFDVVVNYQ